MHDHGVGVIEQSTSLTTPVESAAGLQVIFGTAPIHLLKDPAAAVNKPFLCYSFAECQLGLGYSDDFKDFSLCQSMDASFRVFSVAPVILVNVLDPNKESHTTANEEAEYPVAEGVVRYDKPFVLLNTLSVKNGDTPLTEGEDYLAEHAEDGSVTITLLDEAAEAETVKIASTSLNPAGVTAADIVGGVDVETGTETGIEMVRRIYPKFGMTAGILLAPGTHRPEARDRPFYRRCHRRGARSRPRHRRPGGPGPPLQKALFLRGGELHRGGPQRPGGSLGRRPVQGGQDGEKDRRP